MSRRLLFALLFLHFSFSCFSQIVDDFSDGDFTQNPTWQGSVGDFIVTSAGELRLNGSGTATSMLAVQGNIPDSTIWSLRFRLEFAPSTFNQLRIYLLADQLDLSTANGYFLEIGETGSLDALRFFRQDAGVKTLLATGQPGLVATNPDIRLRAKRTLTGVWELEAAAGNDALQPQFTVTDATFGGGTNRFFGFHCTYTVSNIFKFFFDDISILPDVPDTQPPVLLSANASDATTVTAVFNENLDSLSANNPSNFSINNGIGQPQSAVLLADKRTVNLVLNNPLSTGTYTLQTSGLKDTLGNTSLIQTVDFQFVKIDTAVEFDVLLNEIMADPTPGAGLPEVEWLELFNRSSKSIDLASLRIQDETGTPVQLPSYILSPGAHIALTAITNAATLQAATSGTVIGAAIGTNTLNNDGDILTLSNLDGDVIDRVAYNLDWHTDAGKSDGGWSLERINPNLPCVGSENWQSCPTLPGGTPGEQNASFQNAPDTEAPRLLAAFPESATAVLLTFSEGLDKNVAQNPAAYRINPPRNIASVEQLADDYSKIRLLLGQSLEVSTIYVVSVESTLADCSGNTVPQTDTAYFGLSEMPDLHDVVVNEIMADPDPSAGLPQVEWLELYNRSAKIIDLAMLRIQDETGAPTAIPGYLLLPDRYVVLTATTNAATLQAATPGKVIGVSMSGTLLNNDDDVLIISDFNSNEIDRVAYDMSWHTDAGKADGGWSLERINPNLPCLGSENWHSCPNLPGGTPGAKNASFQNTTDTESPRLLAAFPESATSILLTFSEGLDKNTAQNTASYIINPSRDIASAEQLPDVRSKVRLVLDQSLEVSTLYTITVGSSLTDCIGNAALETDTAFLALPQTPELHDIVINEIMPNPTPSAGLPEEEWLELYNRSGKLIYLSSLRFQDAIGAPILLPHFLLLPGRYVALTAAANAATLQAATPGRVLSTNISAGALNNEEDVLTISDLNGNVIDRVVYTLELHTEAGKEDGGWSLERINPDLPCLSSDNWQSCPVLPGGTPGTQNAAFQNTTDNKPPRLLWAYPESATSLLLTFTEGLDENAVQNTAAYQLSPPRDIASAEQLSGRLQVRLLLDEPLQTSTLYAVVAETSVADCSGNTMPVADTVFVGLPEKPDSQDIVVNEIMFNPATGNARYVEFYNRSNKVFDWTEFFIANFSNINSVQKLTSNRLSLPGRYDIFTTHPKNILTHFANIIPENIVKNSLPSLDDNEGNITLYWSKNDSTVVLDGFDYSRDLHNALFSVSERKGVALERIDTETPTNLAANWTSASPVKTDAPGTPTLPNSQRLSPEPIGNELIQLTTERLSPDDDGFEDFLDIRYSLPQTGFAATMTIYDSEGIPVKRIVRQELIGTEGALRWDGDLDDNTRAKPGIYVLFIELYAPSGATERVKKAVAVVGKF